MASTVELKKMKLQPTTILLFFLALTMSGVVYFREIYGKTTKPEIQTQSPIFTFKADDVQALTVKINSKTLFIQRADTPKYKWIVKSPAVAPASDASVSYLMTLLLGKSDRVFTVAANQLPEYGLQPPQATIEIKLKNQQNHELILGKPDFNHRFLYALADQVTNPSAKTNIFLVSTSFQNAVNRQLPEWFADNHVPVEPEDSDTPPSTATTPTPTPTTATTTTPTSTPPTATTPTPTPPTATTPTPTPTTATTPTPITTSSPSPTNKIP